jgi:hypothetical protein
MVFAKRLPVLVLDWDVRQVAVYDLWMAQPIAVWDFEELK